MDGTPHINPRNNGTGSFIPNWLLERPEVSLGVKLCYARLAQFADKESGIAYPKEETLAPAIGVGVRQVQRYIKELRDLELITIEQIGKRCSNRYRFLKHPWQCGTTDVSTHKAGDTTDMSLRDTTDVSTPLVKDVYKNNNNTDGDRTDMSTHPKADPLFERFWTAYPRKVGKAGARKAWGLLGKKHGIVVDDAFVSRCVQTIEQWRKSEDWTKNGGKYIPHPETWLNGGRWDDEAPATPKPEESTVSKEHEWDGLPKQAVRIKRKPDTETPEERAKSLEQPTGNPFGGAGRYDPRTGHVLVQRQSTPPPAETDPMRDSLQWPAERKRQAEAEEDDNPMPEYMQYAEKQRQQAG